MLIAYSITQYQLNSYAQTDNATGKMANQTISNQNSTTTTFFRNYKPFEGYNMI